MRQHALRLSPEAQTDLVQIHAYVAERSGSAVTADRYIERIADFLTSLDIFPARGTVRDDIRPGLRVIGFERSAAIAFVVEENDVVVLRILAGGQEFRMGE